MAGKRFLLIQRNYNQTLIITKHTCI